jgi:hypothetical protein
MLKMEAWRLKMEAWRVCRPLSQICISLLIIYVRLLLYIALKGLCHEIDLIFDDMHGQF